MHDHDDPLGPDRPAVRRSRSDRRVLRRSSRLPSRRDLPGRRSVGRGAVRARCHGAPRRLARRRRGTPAPVVRRLRAGRRGDRRGAERHRHRHGSCRSAGRGATRRRGARDQPAPRRSALDRRARRDALPRPDPGPPRRELHRLAHPHPRRRTGARLRPLPPRPLPDDLLRQRVGCAWSTRTRASRSCSRPATACCSRPASGTGCSSARPTSRSSRSVVPPSTRRSSSTRSSCRPRSSAPIASSPDSASRATGRRSRAWQPWHRERFRAARPRDRRGDGRSRRRQGRATSRRAIARATRARHRVPVPVRARRHRDARP